MKKILIIAILLMPVFAFANSYANNDAEKFIRNLEGRILGVIQDDALEDDAKQEKLELLFDDIVDVEWIGKFVLGKHWRRATDEQKKDFIATYSEFLKKTYVSNFNKYDGEKVEVKSSRDDGDNKYLVKTAVIQSNGKPLDVVYRIKSKDGKMKVFDIQVEGVSLLNTQREEFTSVVSRDGLDSLIGKMKFRLKSL